MLGIFSPKYLLFYTVAIKRFQTTNNYLVRFITAVAPLFGIRFSGSFLVCLYAKIFGQKT